MPGLLDFIDLTPAGQKVIQDTTKKILPDWAERLLPRREKTPPIIQEKTVIETREVLNKRLMWIIAGSASVIVIFAILKSKKRR